MDNKNLTRRSAPAHPHPTPTPTPTPSPIIWSGQPADPDLANFLLSLFLFTFTLPVTALLISGLKLWSNNHIGIMMRCNGATLLLTNLEVSCLPTHCCSATITHNHFICKRLPLLAVVCTSPRSCRMIVAAVCCEIRLTAPTK